MLVLAITLATLIDFRELIIPDQITLSLIFSSPLVAVIHPDLDLRSSLLGAGLGFSIFYLLSWTYFLLRKRIGLGAGDVKYLAGLGGWLGVQSLLPVVLISSLSASLFGILVFGLKKKEGLQTAFPFGPFLGLGALVFMFGKPWQEWLNLRLF